MGSTGLDNELDFIAIISVLAVYNGIFGRTSHTGHDLTLAGKPLPRWPYSITLNSLIAVFSTVFKVCTAVSSQKASSSKSNRRKRLLMDILRVLVS
jgi:hypothetical protein